MTDISGTLRAARERAGRTLEEISAVTKIKVAQLEALERGEFERLPGEFFTRAFLRTYARELRLAPDELVAAYDARYGRSEAKGAAVPLRPVDHVLHDRVLALPSPHTVWPTLALAAAILLFVYLINRPTPPPPEPPQPVGTAGVATPATPSAPAAKPAPTRLAIEIRPTRVMWVAALSDGKRVLYRLLEPGERVKVDARDELWFRVGDAGAFEYSLNGAPMKALGSPGEVREFRVTRDSLR